MRAMNWTVLVLAVMFMGVMATTGCTSKKKTKEFDWGPSYSDVVVPDYFEKYDNPPFKRQDSEGGSRIYGRYSYQSTKGLLRAEEVAKWFEKNLPNEGWELIDQEWNNDKGTMTALYQKDEDKLEVSLLPEKETFETEAFSVLVVKLNPQFSN